MTSWFVYAQVLGCLGLLASGQLLSASGGGKQRRQLHPQHDFSRALLHHNRHHHIHNEPSFHTGQQREGQLGGKVAQPPPPPSPPPSSLPSSLPSSVPSSVPSPVPSSLPSPSLLLSDEPQFNKQHRLRAHHSPAGDRVVDNDEGRVLTSGRGGHRLPTFDEELFRRQAEEANYSFESSVSDTINDSTHIRQETRDGLKLTGVYSYTDGFFKRTVHYVADENGYRVLKEESEPIGFGPKINPAGHVDVSTNIGGNSLQYTITAADIPSLFERNNVEQINQRKAI